MISNLFPNLRNKFNKIASKLAKSIKRTEFEPGAKTEKDHVIGIRTGELYRSIKPLTASLREEEVEVLVGTNLKYAKYVMKNKYDFLAEGFRKFIESENIEDEIFKEIEKEWRR